MSDTNSHIDWYRRTVLGAVSAAVPAAFSSGAGADQRENRSDLAPSKPESEEEEVVSSIEELADLSDEDNIMVKMEPGVYQISDYITDDRIKTMRANEVWNYIQFSGNGCHYDFTDVTFEIDTAIREKLDPPVHDGKEFFITGDDNVFTGLEIINQGDGTSHAAGVLSVSGNGNHFDGFQLEVRGSWPYGYGDLLGKGANKIPDRPLHKHSAFQVHGDNTTITNTDILMRSFGHGFYFQLGAKNTHLENCSVEGEMRSTNDMLKETEGPAYEHDFESYWPTPRDDGKIPPGYMKSLAEDGFRTYHGASEVSLKNCTAKNMRGGIALGSGGGHQVENCSVIGCERGMYISGETTIRETRVDAKYGPAVIFDGSDISAEVTLAPASSEFMVPGTALLQGSDNDLQITPTTPSEAVEDDWEELPPIRLGFGRSAANNMYSWEERAVSAENYELMNETTTTVEVSEEVDESTVVSAGEIITAPSNNLFYGARGKEEDNSNGLPKGDDHPSNGHGPLGNGKESSK